MNDRPAPSPGWDFWIDRGGTFTDVIGRDPDGVEHTLKLPSASAAYDDAGVEAMRRLLGAAPGESWPGFWPRSHPTARAVRHARTTHHPTPHVTALCILLR